MASGQTDQIFWILFLSNPNPDLSDTHSMNHGQMVMGELFGQETTVWWVRHGPTHAKSFVGWSDLPADLSDAEAIARLADHLPDDAVMVSSDLTRTVKTADALERGHLRLPHEPALREMNFGAWELRHHQEIETEDPERAQAFWETPGDVAPPGGESWNAFSARVNDAVDQLLGRAPQIIAVVHFGVIVSQIQRAMGLEPRDAFSHRIDPLSVTPIRYGVTPEVHRINHKP